MTAKEIIYFLELVFLVAFTDLDLFGLALALPDLSVPDLFVPDLSDNCSGFLTSFFEGFYSFAKFTHNLRNFSSSKQD